MLPRISFVRTVDRAMEKRSHLYIEKGEKRVELIFINIYMCNTRNWL